MNSNMGYAFKIVLVGNQGVGKTSIIQRFISKDFNPRYVYHGVII